MVGKGLRRAISIMLSAAIMLPGAGTARAAEAGNGYADNKGTPVRSSDKTNDDTLSAAGTVDVSEIESPRTSDGVSTWDCIWFGNYWQSDTNGDGHCFEKDTTVTKHEPDQDHGTIYYTDQDGKELEGFEGFDGETKTYPADDKQPIKWRVLDKDEFGNALLLADKLIDIVQYNETQTDDVTWETCTMRSYLNGYDDTQNICGKDFSQKSGNRSFVYSAFDANEIKTISSNEVINLKNTVYDTPGGENTNDRIFCLSLAEVMNEHYGFIKNDFTGPNWGDKKYYTDNDLARVAVTTKFTDDKPGYGGNAAGTSAWWWLRSPGYYRYYASYVDIYGAADAKNYYYGDADNHNGCVRPAFRMNLSSSSSLWRYAGTVNSDGSEEEIGLVTGVTVSPKEKTIRVDGAVALSAKVRGFSNAPDKSVTWTSSDEGIATVDSSGIVTGVKTGTATITATTTEGGYTDTCKVTVVGPDMIVDPSVADGVSTWDCIWFGNYWQEDTNGDGGCYAEETTVDEITYSADDKQPIKWRVLDIDGSGNALLLADKLIDIVQYNETQTDVTWETCTMRSYLNGYDDTQNICGKDFSENSGNRSFVYSAFDENEIKSISSNEVVNSDNPVNDTPGGENTNDRIFCLSLAEAMNPDYGFIKNEFTHPVESDKKYYTDEDPARVAVTTKFTEDKPGYYGNPAGISDWWGLRSPGAYGDSASYVDDNGAVNAYYYYVNDITHCARPAFRMNLSSSSSLWRYAGTVSSDGPDNEIGFVTGITVSPKEKTIRVGGAAALSAEVKEYSKAPDKSVTWTSSDEGIATVDSSGIVTGVKAGTATITATTTEGGYTDTCKVIVVGPDMIADPSVADGVSTWDCIWFGNYWQGDTNGDGHCFEKDTTVTKHDPDPENHHYSEYYTDQDGKELVGFEGEEKTYYADEKEPVKWRVLDIDQSGNALLLADKLIDIVQYNETYADVTWETCTMRSYLNGYDDKQNKCGKDFSQKSGNRSFVYSAFDEEEIKTISSNEVVNPDNPVRGTPGGENTNDRIFCLSLAESMNPDYGFIKNEFTQPDDSDEKERTDDDPARVAVTTKFTDDKPGYDCYMAGNPGWWWLRSPGISSNDVSNVDQNGVAYATGSNVNSNCYMVRPAFRMNLSSSSSLWRYAGTVSSDDKAVFGVYLPETSKVGVGKTITLTPEISPADATDQAVTWKSSAEGVATVSDGVVTGITEGTADITVTTHDGGFTATCRVTVEPASPGPGPGPDTVSVNGVTLPAAGSVTVGKTLTLTPEISPADATDQAVTWKSSAEGVATVSDGVVTGITEGTADITVTTHDGGFTATCRVTVEPASPGPGPGPAPGPDPSEDDPDKDIDPDPEDLELDMLPGEIRRLNINKNGKYVYGVSYVSQDTRTVSVKNGVVTAKNLKKGETEKTVKVTATYNGESADFTITVRAGTPDITPGEKGSKITAPKTVKADVGTSKTVTAAVKLPKALQGKEVRAKVVLPEDLPGTSVADGDTENDIFDLVEGEPDAKGTKVPFVITPREAGAAYIVWTVTDDSGKEPQAYTQAYTKVLIKNPLSTLSVNLPEDVIELSVGGGERLTVITEKGNTDSKDMSFSVKMKKGKGIRVSKSGFVTAASPDAEAEVTVKSGKVKKTVTVKVDPYSGSVLALSKTSVSAKRPKTGGKPKTVSLKISAPKKNPPAVNWSITVPPEDKDPEGITVKDGKVTVTDGASPGCYTVTAAPGGSSGYNPACCEVIVR